jgi:hypothetical protein
LREYYAKVTGSHYVIGLDKFDLGADAVKIAEAAKLWGQQKGKKCRTIP